MFFLEIDYYSVLRQVDVVFAVIVQRSNKQASDKVNYNSILISDPEVDQHLTT